SLIESIHKHLPNFQLTDADTVMQRARLIKLAEEIPIIEEACAIGDSVTQRALDETRAGRRECDVAGDALQTLYYLGGEMPHVITAKVSKHGFGENLFSLFIGHGIGIGANEPPYIGETLPGATVYELRPNMVFAVEPLVWVPDIQGGGGVRIEDMVLVTEGDPRILSR